MGGFGLHIAYFFGGPLWPPAMVVRKLLYGNREVEFGNAKNVSLA